MKKSCSICPFVTFISLRIMSWRLIHVVACVTIFFLFKTKVYSIVCICNILFIHSSLDENLRCFQLLAIVSNSSMNTDILNNIFTSNLLVNYHKKALQMTVKYCGWWNNKVVGWTTKVPQWAMKHAGKWKIHFNQCPMERVYLGEEKNLLYLFCRMKLIINH